MALSSVAHSCTHVIYRGQVRRVFAVMPAKHQGHRFFLLRYKTGAEPRDAHTVFIGPRGQRHVIGVLVRADHCQPALVKAQQTGKRGRPRIRKVRKA